MQANPDFPQNELCSKYGPKLASEEVMWYYKDLNNVVPLRSANYQRREHKLTGAYAMDIILYPHAHFGNPPYKNLSLMSKGGEVQG